MIALSNIHARGRLNVKLEAISLEAPLGVTAIVGAPHDGTTLLFDVLDRTIAPKLGTFSAPARVHIARVTLDAPLPDAMSVEEVCALSTALRGEPRVDALTPLNLESLAKRSTRSLTVDERRAVTLAIALASKAMLLLIEEPLAYLAPLAARVVADAIRERAKTASVLAVTASPRDATRVGDRIAVLTNGRLTPIEESNTVSRDAGSLRVVVAASQGKPGAAALIGALGREDVVTRIDSAAFAAGKATALMIHGDDLAALAQAVTRAVAAAKVDIDLVEPSVLPLDAIRALITATAEGHTG